MPSDFFSTSYCPKREALRRKWEAHLTKKGVSLNRVSAIARTKADKGQEPRNARD